jgi:hypothetical protein
LFCLEIRKIFVPLFLLESSNFMKLFASTRWSPLLIAHDP